MYGQETTDYNGETGDTQQYAATLEQENEMLRQRVMEQNSQLTQFQQLQGSLEQALQMVNTLAQDFQRLQQNMAQAGVLPLVEGEKQVEYKDDIAKLLYDGTKMWAYFPKEKKKRIVLYMRESYIIVGGTMKEDGVFQFPIEDISDIYMGKGQASPGFCTPYAASLDPDLCFTIMATRPERKKIVFDLVAPDPETREGWLKGLRRALTGMGKTLSITEAPMAGAARRRVRKGASGTSPKKRPVSGARRTVSRNKGSTTRRAASTGGSRRAASTRSTRGASSSRDTGSSNIPRFMQSTTASKAGSRRRGASRRGSPTKKA